MKQCIRSKIEKRFKLIRRLATAIIAHIIFIIFLSVSIVRLYSQPSNAPTTKAYMTLGCRLLQS